MNRNNPFFTKLWADAMLKEASRVSSMTWLVKQRAAWDALPWYVKCWRRVKSRCSELSYRIIGAWRVLTGRADWE